MGSQTTPPLAPPNGMPMSEHFHVIHIDERLDLVEGDVGVVADAALGRAAGDVVLDAKAL